MLAKYAYDALGRLTQTQGGATCTPIETYGYDATGNRTRSPPRQVPRATPIRPPAIS